MSYDGWPDLARECPCCGGPCSAIYKGYYKRLVFCPELEFTGQIAIRTAYCKKLKIRYALFPDFLIPRRRISKLSLTFLLESHKKHPNRPINAIDDLISGLDDEFYLPLSTAYVYLKLAALAPP